jgi:hypothetical protein
MKKDAGRKWKEKISEGKKGRHGLLNSMVLAHAILYSVICGSAFQSHKAGRGGGVIVIQRLPVNKISTIDSLKL